ncbi:hypothetical protein [Polaromonas sp.]|uniref:hypothetical protein n=1 Tax=Polaromonas sp. TaxID=1869339 RepID=UPI001DA22062|nr:hypothetical protein [Polaromonas sp.]MBT9477396.1 hypothetical protein [Polaromonas sp.]
MQTHVEIQRGALDHAPLLGRSAAQGFAAPVQHKKARFTATRLQVASVVFGLFFAFTGGMLHAQGASGTAAAAPLTREQVKMERDEFLRTHQWDAVAENWVLKQGMEAPAGVKTRAEVKAERNEFLRNNRWNPVSGDWEPLTKGPRDVSKMSREQVRNETRQFIRTHQWDEVKGAWVEVTPRKARK